MSWPTRRIVTGHADDGRSVIVSDGVPPVVHEVGEDAAFVELWNTNAAPAPIAATEAEPTERPVRVPPEPSGTIIRVVELKPHGKSPMHRTQTVDYGIVLEGECYLVLTDSETRIGPGDVVVQRGTDHAWENRSDAPCRIAFVLVDGLFDEELRSLIGEAELMDQQLR